MLVSFRFNFDYLCECLGNQIIYLCQKTIDITNVLNQDVDLVLDSIHKCLQCSNMFISEYNEVIYHFIPFKHIII